jgi:hypothetical protein
VIPDAAAPPARVIWVAPGQTQGDGSRSAPYATIQRAVTAAGPGTAILVRAGAYRENVVIPRRASGSPSRPVWLISIDGPQAAHIVAPDGRLAGLGGGGVRNVIVQGFRVTGGRNGIQFSQNGYAFDKLIGNIVIRGNLIEDATEDGIKVNGGENVLVENNVTRRTGDQGVDFVAIVGGRIADNEVSENRGVAAMLAKGGSQDIEISGNHIHDVAVDGITVGGWMNPRIPYRPGYDSFEARNITVRGNRIERVGKRPINILGGQQSTISGNYLEANPGYRTIIEVGPSSPKGARIFPSSNIVIRGNVLTRGDRQIKISRGSTAISFRDNVVARRWGGRAGADLAAGKPPAHIALPLGPGPSPRNGWPGNNAQRKVD